MKHQPSYESIVSIVSSMRIEGFPASYTAVRHSLEELYRFYDIEKMDELVRTINSSGVDRRALILDFTDAIERQIEAECRLT